MISYFALFVCCTILLVEPVLARTFIISKGKGYPLCYEFLKVLQAQRSKSCQNLYRWCSSDLVLSPKFRNFSEVSWHFLSKEKLSNYFIKMPPWAGGDYPTWWAFRDYPTPYGFSPIYIDKRPDSDLRIEWARLDINNDRHKDLVLRYRWVNPKDDSSFSPPWNLYISDKEDQKLSETFPLNIINSGVRPFIYGGTTYLFYPDGNLTSILKPKALEHNPSETAGLPICYIQYH